MMLNLNVRLSFADHQGVAAAARPETRGLPEIQVRLQEAAHLERAQLH